MSEWEGGPMAFEVEVSDEVLSVLSDKIFGHFCDFDDDRFDHDLDVMDMTMQFNVWPNGSWEIVGVGGHPIDKTKKLRNV